MSKTYYRPILSTDPARPEGAYTLAGGWCWFDRCEVIRREGRGEIIAARDVPPQWLARLTAPRADMMGLSFDRPRIMGILNVTPDSFSDGGTAVQAAAAVEKALILARDGAEILDIGGESTRPGSDFVPIEDEIARVMPALVGIREVMHLPLSIDTRKGAVAEVALDEGAALINDVAALTYDAQIGPAVAASGKPVCLMHFQGDPKTMQDAPVYDDVTLDVYDFLEERISAAEALGIERSRILIDPGIGFGKTLQHNVTLLRDLALYHGLGCGVLLGVSRKRFIGTLADVPEAAHRMPGSLAVALHGVSQGMQVLRVHDVQQTRQALRLHWSMMTGE